MSDYYRELLPGEIVRKGDELFIFDHWRLYTAVGLSSGGGPRTRTKRPFPKEEKTEVEKLRDEIASLRAALCRAAGTDKQELRDRLAEMEITVGGYRAAHEHNEKAIQAAHSKIQELQEMNECISKDATEKSIFIYDSQTGRYESRFSLLERECARFKDERDRYRAGSICLEKKLNTLLEAFDKIQ